RAHYRALGRWLIGIIALLAATLGACTVYWDLTGTTANDAKRMIEKNLPRGSGTAEIVAFLESRDISHYDIERFHPNSQCCQLQNAGVVPGTMILPAFMVDTGHN